MNTSRQIKQKALSLGFSSVGISKAEELSKEAQQLENWLNKGLHGEMEYMEKNFEKRINPKHLFPDAKSIISVTGNYFQAEKNQAKELGKISIYAQSEDYHVVMKRKLVELFEFICDTIGEVNGNAFVDSAPMMDKAWAERSGLGWIGKHSNLISKEIGSYFFIGSLILDCELEYDQPKIQNYCGNCTACMDLCPTHAIVAPNQVDARKCISYLTIELKRDFTEEEQSMIGNWLFGCDICQQVCPWNRFSEPTSIQELYLKKEVQKVTEADILSMTKSAFKNIFGETPIFRTGLRRLKRNSNAVLQNQEKKKSL